MALPPLDDYGSFYARPNDRYDNFDSNFAYYERQYDLYGAGNGGAPWQPAYHPGDLAHALLGITAKPD
jgi:hypothetical protein